MNDAVVSTKVINKTTAEEKILPNKMLNFVPALSITVISPQEEQCDKDATNKGFVSKRKTFTTKWNKD